MVQALKGSRASRSQVESPLLTKSVSRRTLSRRVRMALQKIHTSFPQERTHLKEPQVTSVLQVKAADKASNLPYRGMHASAVFREMKRYMSTDVSSSTAPIKASAISNLQCSSALECRWH